MIEVEIRTSRKDVARLRIECVKFYSDNQYGDYTVQIAIDTGGGSLAIYQKSIYAFPRKKLNALALVLAALTTMSEEEFGLDADPDASRSPNLVRELDRAMREV
jgi:hypothetical protein